MKTAAWIGFVALALAGACWKGPGATVEVPPATVRILPGPVTLTAGHEQRFTARFEGGPAGAVAWRVLEPGGGSVDADGAYRAPAAPGVYTVEAGARGGPGRDAARVTVVAPPAGDILAPARTLPGTAGLRASVAGVPGSRYAWSIAGGQLTGGEDTAAVTFTAGAGPKVRLTCRVTNAAGDSLDSSLEVPVAAPVSLAIQPAQVTLTAGRAMKFGFTIEGGISLGVTWSLGEPGAGSLDQAGHYVAPEVPGAYSVRVAAKDDPTRTATARVQVVARPPEALVAPAAFEPGATGLRASVPEVAGMTYAWSIEGGAITSGAGTPAVVFSAGPGPSLTLRCRISNGAGDSFLASQVLKVAAR